MSLESFARALGGRIEHHEPFDVDGRPVAASVRPGDVEQLGLTLRAASDAGLAAIPCGGRTRLQLGNPPSRADFLLRLDALSGVETFDASEGVCRVAAGTSLGALREAVEQGVWLVPLDAPDASTLGGALACGAVGPRSHGWGLPRDVVLGLDVVQASGVRTRCGGRVVKNVTGYDLAKLYTGSLGTLGVIASAWLRLRPAPARVRVLELDLPASDAARIGIEVSRGTAVRACVLVSAGPDFRLVVELAGDEASVAQSEAHLSSALGTRASGDDVLAAVRRRQTELAGGRLRFRLGVLPSRLEGVLAGLSRAGGSLLAHPGPGLVYAIFEGERGDAAFAAVADAAIGGDWCCEAAAPERKRGHDVWGDLGSRRSLARTLKERFDPGNVLNPGRFAGGV